MKPCRMFSPWIIGTLLSIAVSGYASGDSRAAMKGSGLAGAAQDSAFRENPKDLLDLQKLTRRLDLSPAQQDSAGQMIDRMRNVLEAFGWDDAKRTCEASVWGQDPPASETLKARKRKAIEDMKGLLMPFAETLGEDQKTRLRGLTRGLNRLLNLPPSGKVPFIHVDTRPIFDRVENRRLVRRTTFTDPPALDPSQTYADVLKAWTIRTFLRGDDAPQHDVADYSVWDVRQNMQVLKGRLIQSSLIAAATLVSPDLVEAEIQHLHQYYNPDGRSLEAIRTAYRMQNRVGEAILIRLKLGTPYAAPFLARKNWTIFIEDDTGSAYEPVEEQAQAARPREGIALDIPGRTYEAVYHEPTRVPDPSVSKRETIFWADESERVAYAGNEALVKLFFPARRRDGTPVVTPETESLRLIIKPAEGDGYEIVMTWTFGQPKKQ